MAFRDKEAAWAQVSMLRPPARGDRRPPPRGGRTPTDRRQRIVADLIDGLESNLDDMTATIVRTMRTEIPAYADITSVRRLEALQETVRTLVELFFATTRRGRRLAPDEERLVAAITADPSEQAISLQSVLSGVRLAMRIGWQFGVAQAKGMDQSPDAVEALGVIAARLFDFVDDVSTTVTERHLTEEQARLTRRERDRRSMLDDLLAGAFPSEADIVTVAAAHGVNLGTTQLLILVTTSSPDARWTIREATASLSRRISGAAAIPVSGGPTPHAVLLCPVDNTERRSAALATADAVARSHGVLVLAVAGLVAPAAVHNAYRRASEDLELVVSLHNKPGLVEAADLVVYRILTGDPDEQRAFIATTLGPVLALPPAHGRPILETLEALQAGDGSVEAAALTLHVHPKTVRYRLGRLTELTGLHFHRPPDRFHLGLAMHLVKIHRVDARHAAVRPR
jgi:sugar diacid utilization regulator